LVTDVYRLYRSSLSLVHLGYAMQRKIVIFVAEHCDALWLADTTYYGGRSQCDQSLFQPIGGLNIQVLCLIYAVFGKLGLNLVLVGVLAQY